MAAMGAMLLVWPPGGAAAGPPADGAGLVFVEDDPNETARPATASRSIPVPETPAPVPLNAAPGDPETGATSLGMTAGDGPD